MRSDFSLNIVFRLLLSEVTNYIPSGMYLARSKYLCLESGRCRSTPFVSFCGMSPHMVVGVSVQVNSGERWRFATVIYKGTQIITP